jgi:ficolin
MEIDGCGGSTVFQKPDDFIAQEHGLHIFSKRNDRLFLLKSQDLYKLRVDLEDQFDKNKRYAHYYSFQVANKLDKYRLTIGQYIQDTACDFLKEHGHMEDNDILSTDSCLVVQGLSLF